ncbi:MAG: stage 0 sporulation protein [Lentisphaerae bacterium]|nr:stage 0 sporulation protein [Lentisphaerota bacterium]
MDRTAYVEVEGGPRMRCRIPEGLAIHEGDQCVLEADRVLEMGRLADIEETAVPADPALPRIVRRATLQDQARAHESAVRSKMAAETVADRAAKYSLKIDLVRVRFSFDGGVLMVLYTSDERPDFREMVKELSGDLRARVEMHQIGVRDQAGIVGGMGPCGRALCCCSWLRNFASVNLRMAKVQHVSLNPLSIGGLCGRLKCCLRYEYDCYREMARQLPRDGAAVECPAGCGRVLDLNVLAQKVRIRLEDQRTVQYGASEVREVGAAQGPRADEEHAGEEDDDRVVG